MTELPPRNTTALDDAAEGWLTLNWTCSPSSECGSASAAMADLGYLDDPADRLGMLSMQCMRAGRVVIDIGLHAQKTRPDGQGLWTGECAGLPAPAREH